MERICIIAFDSALADPERALAQNIDLAIMALDIRLREISRGKEVRICAQTGIYEQLRNCGLGPMLGRPLEGDPRSPSENMRAYQQAVAYMNDAGIERSDIVSAPKRLLRAHSRNLRTEWSATLRAHPWRHWFERIARFFASPAR